MDVKYINPFLEAVKIILGEFGIQDIRRGNIVKKESMHVDMDITSVIGLIGDVRGNIAYSLSQETAKAITSAMMMGMPVTQMDALARSAIGELTNMITGRALGILNSTNLFIDITPPSIIFGNDIYFIISSVQTITVDMLTPMGKIEINIGLEV
ncbi:MAG: chemotaxis protein CheX [Clostridia bacterium]|nr:chemotaxis protein CheX [Clostridia bacterium]